MIGAGIEILVHKDVNLSDSIKQWSITILCCSGWIFGVAFKRFCRYYEINSKGGSFYGLLKHDKFGSSNLKGDKYIVWTIV